MPAHKIATCCYCGTRAVLKLRGIKRHELSCSSCGAPLHELKQLPVRKSEERLHSRAGSSPSRPARGGVHTQSQRPRKTKRKARGQLWGRLVSEIWDEIEDIFD